MASILLVEDEEDLRFISARLLEFMGHQVEAVGSGEAAIRSMAASRYDFVLTDIGLPKMDGWDVARAAKALPRPPIVGLVSGWEIPPHALSLRQRGVDFILNKPYSLDEMEEKLKQYE